MNFTKKLLGAILLSVLINACTSEQIIINKELLFDTEIVDQPIFEEEIEGQVVRLNSYRDLSLLAKDNANPPKVLFRESLEDKTHLVKRTGLIEEVLSDSQLYYELMTKEGEVLYMEFDEIQNIWTLMNEARTVLYSGKMELLLSYNAQELVFLGSQKNPEDDTLSYLLIKNGERVMESVEKITLYQRDQQDPDTFAYAIRSTNRNEYIVKTNQNDQSWGPYEKISGLSIDKGKVSFFAKKTEDKWEWVIAGKEKKLEENIIEVYSTYYDTSSNDAASIVSIKEEEEIKYIHLDRRGRKREIPGIPRDMVKTSRDWFVLYSDSQGATKIFNVDRGDIVYEGNEMNLLNIINDRELWYASRELNSSTWKIMRGDELIIEGIQYTEPTNIYGKYQFMVETSKGDIYSLQTNI